MKNRQLTKEEAEKDRAFWIELAKHDILRGIDELKTLCGEEETKDYINSLLNHD